MNIVIIIIMVIAVIGWIIGQIGCLEEDITKAYIGVITILIACFVMLIYAILTLL